MLWTNSAIEAKKGWNITLYVIWWKNEHDHHEFYSFCLPLLPHIYVCLFFPREYISDFLDSYRVNRNFIWKRETIIDSHNLCYLRQTFGQGLGIRGVSCLY
jgi:hypothetical protein